MTPLVSVVIPVRNEAVDLRACLEAVLAQDYPHDRIEVLVVDGGSTDGSPELAGDVLSRSDLSWAVIDNPTGTTPSNLNVGLARASGSILCRVDARSLISVGHVRLCTAALLAEPTRVVVGGGQRAVARPAASVVARGIARALNNRWTTGLARYRRSSAAGPADTVYLGAFFTEALRQVGGWAMELPTNQDFDLNQRLRAHGSVWFDPALTVRYLPRETLGALGRQYFRFGRWKRRYWRLRSTRPTPRQWALLALPPACGALGLVAVIRAPVPALAVAGTAGILLDAAGGEGRADVRVRAAGLLAGLVSSVSWWAGVIWERPRG